MKRLPRMTKRERKALLGKAQDAIQIALPKCIKTAKDFEEFDNFIRAFEEARETGRQIAFCATTDDPDGKLPEFNNIEWVEQTMDDLLKGKN